jgi:tetratricopeptide (TPR) repeat protein
MKRIVLAGALVTAFAAGLVAQPTTAQPPAAGAPAQAPKGPSPDEVKALQAVMAASQGGDFDGVIKAAEDVVTRFPDSTYKDMVLSAESDAYKGKRDWIKAQIYAEQALAANPKSYQANLQLSDLLAQHTGEHDLDKEEKLTKADKYAHQALDLLATAPKPQPNLPDAQWDGYKQALTAQAQHDLALSAMSRKKWDDAIAAFKAAIAIDPQPAYKVQMASALQSQGKNDEAIALCDEVLAMPQLHPAIQAAAKNIKEVATKAKGK